MKFISLKLKSVPASLVRINRLILAGAGLLVDGQTCTCRLNS